MDTANSRSASVLLVEDDPVSRRGMQAALERKFRVTVAENGDEAIEKLSSGNFAVIVTDLKMPGMSGGELIEKVTDTETHPLIIVQTAVDDVKTAIELMKKGIHDYFVKPVHPAELEQKVIKAAEFHKLTAMREQIEKEHELRNSQILNWNLWKEQVIKRSIDKNDDSLIHSIRTNLSQGLGFGALTTLITMIRTTAKEDGENLIVPKNLMEMLYDNSDAAKKVIDMFDRIAAVISDPFKPENVKPETIRNWITAEIESIDKFRKLRKHSVQTGDLPRFGNGTVQIHETWFREAVHELLMNSLKFSPDHSTVYVLFTGDKQTLRISFMNEFQEYGNSIPDEAKNLLFEPFFRLSKNVMEDYETLDFGLGLSFVDKVIRAHNGKIRISNVRTHLGKEANAPFVSFEIELPVHTS